jgi:hypothetical protein
MNTRKPGSSTSRSKVTQNSVILCLNEDDPKINIQGENIGVQDDAKEAPLNLNCIIRKVKKPRKLQATMEHRDTSMKKVPKLINITEASPSLPFKTKSKTPARGAQSNPFSEFRPIS